MSNPSTSFGVTKVLTAMKMADVPKAWKPRLQELSRGPYAGGTWQWVHHDGSTWVAIIAEGAMTPDNFVGWAAITHEEEHLPVVGVYVTEERRGLGYAEDVVKHLLTMYPQAPGDVYAASRYWPDWVRVLGYFGLGAVEWA